LWSGSILHIRGALSNPLTLFEQKQTAAGPVKNWRDDLCVVQFLDSIPDGDRRCIIPPLLIVNGYLRCSFAHFELGANLLDLGGLLLQTRGKRFNLLLLLSYSCFLFLSGGL